MSSKKKVVLLSSIVASVAVLATVAFVAFFVVRNRRSRNVNQEDSDNRQFIAHNGSTVSIKLSYEQGNGIDEPYQVVMTSNAVDGEIIEQFNFISRDEAIQKRDELISENRSIFRTYIWH